MDAETEARLLALLSVGGSWHTWAPRLADQLRDELPVLRRIRATAESYAHGDDSVHVTEEGRAVALAILDGGA